MPLDKVDITTHHSVHPLLPTTHTLYSRSAVLYEEGNRRKTLICQQSSVLRSGSGIQIA